MADWLRRRSKLGRIELEDPQMAVQMLLNDIYNLIGAKVIRFVPRSERERIRLI
jgi:hypothetical protein